MADDIKDLFICDTGEFVAKDARNSLEFSLFSLQKKIDTKPKTYEDGNGNFIKINPNSYGRPTIYDNDLILYAISRIVEQRNKGEPIGQDVVIQTYDFLQKTGRSVGGQGYLAIPDSLRRLLGTSIETNIRTGDIDLTEGATFITGYKIKTESKTGKVLQFSMRLNDWFYQAAKEMDVLTLNSQFFAIESGIERRLYQLARKHLGNQKEFKIGWEKLYSKSGTASALKGFKFAIRKIIQNDGILDYNLVEDGNNVVFTHKQKDDGF